MHIVFIALGSNLGDRQENLRNAVDSLSPKVVPLKCSPIYETPPWGYTDQPNFLNQVVKAETNLSPNLLLSYLKEIESSIGRQETFRFGPRLIDLDLLFYNGDVIESPPLTVPHPQLAERAFVLMPLADLAPEFVHPTLHLTVADMLTKVDQQGISHYASGSCGEAGG